MILYAQIKGNDLIKEKQTAHPEFKAKHPEKRKREKIKSGAYALRTREKRKREKIKSGAYALRTRASAAEKR